ncbi:MAG TPA: DUF2281 domain-containing protein [Spirochaetota bacterium]|nr:DUF2281 domain-containing protein [Spirochaetota bacterium]
MIKLEDIQRMPDEIKKEILDYAEYLIAKYQSERDGEEIRWVDVRSRGRSIGEMASDTVVKLRNEARW